MPTKIKEAVGIASVLPEVVKGIKPETPPKHKKPETSSPSPEYKQKPTTETPQKDNSYSVREPSKLETRLYEKITSHPTRNVSMWVYPETVKIDPESKKVFFSSPNKFGDDWLKENYKTYLLGCVNDILGEGYKVTFRVEKDLTLFDNPKVIGTSTKPIPKQKTARLEKKIDMPHDCTFRDVGLSDGNKEALVTLKRIYADIVYERSPELSGKIFALLGEPETGKKYHASALAHTLAKKGIDSWYLNLNHLASKLNDTKGEFNKKLKPPKGIKVAIFGDIDGCFKGRSPRPGTQRGFLKCLNLIKSSPEKIQVIFTGSENPKKLAKKLREYDLTLDDEDTRKGIAPALAAKIEGVTRIYLDHPSSKEELRGFVSGLVRHNCRNRKDLEGFLDFYMGMVPKQPRLSEVCGDVDTIKTYLENHGNLGLTPENATEALRYQRTFFDPKDLPDIILDIIIKKHGVTKENLKKRSRKRELSNARREAFFALREFTNLNLEDIAALLKKTHTSVMYAVNKVGEEEGKKLLGEVKGELLNRGINLE